MNRFGMKKPGDLCSRCKERPVEVIEDWVADMCPSCNDAEAERYRERSEFAYYHPLDDE